MRAEETISKKTILKDAAYHCALASGYLEIFSTDSFAYKTHLTETVEYLYHLSRIEIEELKKRIAETLKDYFLEDQKEIFDFIDDVLIVID